MSHYDVSMKCTMIFSITTIFIQQYYVNILLATMKSANDGPYYGNNNKFSSTIAHEDYIIIN